MVHTRAFTYCCCCACAALQTVDTLVFHQTDYKWAQGFVATGGFIHLIHIISRYTHHLPLRSAVSHELSAAPTATEHVSNSPYQEVFVAAGRRVLELVLRIVLSFCYAYLRKNHEYLLRYRPFSHSAFLFDQLIRSILLFYSAAPTTSPSGGARPIYVPSFEMYLLDVNQEAFLAKLAQLVRDCAVTSPELTQLPGGAGAVGGGTQPLTGPLPLPPVITSFPHPPPTTLSVNGEVANHALCLFSCFAMTYDPTTLIPSLCMSAESVHVVFVYVQFAGAVQSSVPRPRSVDRLSARRPVFERQSDARHHRFGRAPTQRQSASVLGARRRPEAGVCPSVQVRRIPTPLHFPLLHRLCILHTHSSVCVVCDCADTLMTL